MPSNRRLQSIPAGLEARPGVHITFDDNDDIWVKFYDRDGPLGHKRPASMLLFVFEGFFSIHCHSADEEGVPGVPGHFMARGQSNRRTVRRRANFGACQWNFVFRTSRATLAHLPFY